ncbi:MAG: hypothetical protein AB1861_11790 [Cyanobacteriota bacterium]
MVFVGYKAVNPYKAHLVKDITVGTMESDILDMFWMPEKRDGQELIRLYLPSELKEKFKLYCHLKGLTMTEVVKEQVEQLVRSEDFTQLLGERLKESPSSKDKGQ